VAANTIPCVTTTPRCLDCRDIRRTSSESESFLCFSSGVGIPQRHPRRNKMATQNPGMTRRLVEVVAADLGKKADLARVEDILRTNTNITMLVNKMPIGDRQKTGKILLESAQRRSALSGWLNTESPMPISMRSSIRSTKPRIETESCSWGFRNLAQSQARRATKPWSPPHSEHAILRHHNIDVINPQKNRNAKLPTIIAVAGPEPVGFMVVRLCCRLSI